MTTNHTDTTITIIYLPKYIQKYIIKIICEYINHHNSQFTSYYYDQQYYEIDLNNEKLIRQEIQSISMVNKVWFISISNNLFISNDFLPYRNVILKKKLFVDLPIFNKDNEINHYIIKRLIQQKQQSSINKLLLKDENVTELILNIDQWCFDITKKDLPNLLFNLINETLKNRYINLKRISISSIHKYKFISFIEFDYIRIRECVCDFNTSLPSNIKEIDTLDLIDGDHISIEEAYQLFNLNSIKQLCYSISWD